MASTDIWCTKIPQPLEQEIS